MVHVFKLTVQLVDGVVEVHFNELLFVIAKIHDM